MTTKAEFARRIIVEGKWPDHVNNYVALIAWMSAEFSPSETKRARNNPLATTRAMLGASDFNTSHVKNYPTLEIGVKATVATLRNGNYPNVLACLNDKEPAGVTLLAVERGATNKPRWGTSFDPSPIVFVEGVRSHWSQHAFDVVPS